MQQNSKEAGPILINQ